MWALRAPAAAAVALPRRARHAPAAVAAPIHRVLAVLPTARRAPLLLGRAPRARLSSTAPTGAVPEPGFALSSDGLTLTTSSPAAGHALSVALPDGGGADARCAVAAGSPRVDVVVESGWRDTLEVQLLLALPAEGGPAAPRVFAPVRLLPDRGAASLLLAAASPTDGTVDVSVTAEALRRLLHLSLPPPVASSAAGSANGAPSFTPPPPLHARLLLRTPQQLDTVRVHAGCAVACDVVLGGKLEAELVDVAACAGGITADRVRGTRVSLVACGSGGVVVRSLLEAGTASVRCDGGGGFTAGKLLGDTVHVAVSARGRVSIAAAYVRQLTVEAVEGGRGEGDAGANAEAAPPADDAPRAPAPPPAATITTTAPCGPTIRVDSLHGTAALRAEHGDVAVGGLTGCVTVRAQRGSVALHVDSARGASSVHCAGDAAVTLMMLPPSGKGGGLASGGSGGGSELGVTATSSRVTLPPPSVSEEDSDGLGARVSQGAALRGSGSGSGKIATTGAGATGFYFGSGAALPSGLAGGAAARVSAPTDEPRLSSEAAPAGALATLPSSGARTSASGTHGGGRGLGARMSAAAAPGTPGEAAGVAELTPATWAALRRSGATAVAQRVASAAGVAAAGAGGIVPSLDIVAGDSASVALVDWQTLVRSRMAAGASAVAAARSRGGPAGPGPG